MSVCTRSFNLAWLSNKMWNIPVRIICLRGCMNSVSKEIVESLERLSLVDFPTAAGVERLEKSIKFADQILEVDTSKVEELISTVHTRNENLHSGSAVNVSHRKELMKIASESEEFYYVAPLGTFTSRKEKNMSPKAV